MKRKIISVLTLGLIVAVCLTLLTGCPSNTKAALEIGFRYDRRPGSLIAAVKSEKTEFDIDDVTLDFYYGGEATEYTESLTSDSAYIRRYENVSFGVYFLTKDDIELRISDYKNIDGLHFVKEISIDEFNDGPHDISIKWGPQGDRRYFHYCEKLTVPSEIFVGEYGRFKFLVSQVVYDHQEEAYTLMNGGGVVSIQYNRLEDNKVRLSDAS